MTSRGYGFGAGRFAARRNDNHLAEVQHRIEAMADETHSAVRRSWVASANGHPDFPIQNLPLGAFAPPGGAARGGSAIGDEVFDLAAALELGRFEGIPARAAEAASGTTLSSRNGKRKSENESVPSFGPSRSLDCDLERGVWIGPGNGLGTPIPIAEAPIHNAGFCLPNDWPGRDIQGWKYQPLGPFLGK